MVYRGTQAISIDALWYCTKEFIQRRGRKPEAIIMHPSDAEVFVEIMNRERGYMAMENLLRFDSAKIMRSFDVEQGKWCNYENEAGTLNMNIAFLALKKLASK